MLDVYAGSHFSGSLDANGRGSAFTYDRSAATTDLISILMPLSAASYNWPAGLHPIFQMNLPEGSLRERIWLDFNKASARGLSDIDIIGIVGHQQIGRLRYIDPNAEPIVEPPEQSIDDIIKADRNNELYEYLLRVYAAHSGISGVQPKVMVRDSACTVLNPSPRSIRNATHIVKFWDEYPEMAANEFFCLTAARRAGIETPDFQISEDGRALVLRRFDLKFDGSYLGFEDLCVLNQLEPSRKYEGGYETKLFRSLSMFVTDKRDLRKAFEYLIFSYAVRNGDAHLKNFGVIYDDPQGSVSLAPAFDIVSTTPYIEKDRAALTLDGSKNWPDRKKLERLGMVRLGYSKAELNSTFERIADAISETRPGMHTAISCRNSRVADRVASAWDEGLRQSLGVVTDAVPVAAKGLSRRRKVS